MIGKGVKYYSSLILSQERPVRFVVAQLLRQSGLCRWFSIRRRFYKIQFSPTAYSAVLWADPASLNGDEEFLVSYLRAGDTMVDIGANIGALTLTAAALVGEGGAVYTVEAHPRTFRCLERNISENGFNNVYAFNFAMGHEQGMISFSDKRADDTNSIVSHSGLEVPVITLDALISPKVKNVSLLKIDVEGYERFVCLGARDLLKKTDCIYIESCESNFRSFGYSTPDLLRTLKSEGFAVFSSVAGGRVIPEDHISECCENLIAVRNTEILSTRLGWTLDKAVTL